MKLRKTAVAMSVATLAALGLAGNAAADVYAGSRLLIQNFTILTFDATTFAPVFPLTYGFRISNTVNLNGGLPVATTNSCNGTFGGATTCNATLIGPVLDALPASVPGGVRVNNVQNYLGPGGLEYSSADNVIERAELVNPNTATRAHMISESELQTGTQGAGSSTITSQTDYTFTFTNNQPGPVSLILDFEADPSLWAHIDDALADPPTQSRATISANFALTQNSTGDGASWSPQGTLLNDCSFSGVGCVELDDSEDLNRSLSTSTLPVGNSTYSRLPNVGGGLDMFGAKADAGFQRYRILITGIGQGDWNIALGTTVTSDVSRTAVPEPGTLMLLGAGLLGLGARRLRLRNRLG